MVWRPGGPYRETPSSAGDVTGADEATGEWPLHILIISFANLHS